MITTIAYIAHSYNNNYYYVTAYFHVESGSGKAVQIYAYPGPYGAKWYLTVSEYENGGVGKYPTFTPEDEVRLLLHESSYI